MNRVTFFAAVRASLFGGALLPGQVTGLQAFLAAWDKAPAPDVRWLAYALATAYHETNRGMVGTREIGLGQGHPYGVPDPVTHQVYYGRGPVQLTWRRNYQAMTVITGLDLVRDPDLALDPETGALIALYGMVHGTFTGKALNEFFNPTTDEPVAARRVINGTDRADLVAGYHGKFLAALLHAQGTAAA